MCIFPFLKKYIYNFLLYIQIIEEEEEEYQLGGVKINMANYDFLSLYTISGCMNWDFYMSIIAEIILVLANVYK